MELGVFFTPPDAALNVAYPFDGVVGQGLARGWPP